MAVGIVVVVDGTFVVALDAVVFAVVVVAVVIDVADEDE